MRALTVLLGVLCSVHQALTVQRPYQLVLHRNVHTAACSFLSLRETQLHKGLSGEPGSYVAERLPPNHPLVDGHEHPQDIVERLRFFSYDKDVLWSQARAICGNESLWNHTVLLEDPPNVLENSQDDYQVVLSTVERTNVANVRTTYPALQVQSLILSGDSSNRVDLVFFSDGYTSEEQPKFLEDANRLAQDISSNQTFNTVKPLLNFWAAFTPSNESGIGAGGEPKDTPFGLYRDGTELRGVYYSKPDEARAACFSMGDKCDYPILMGNDPLYGGLGGEFTVITPSLANGALVLRHELGHSVIEVGEEYDGGYAYSGVNAAHNLSAPLPWTQWLTEPATVPPRVERSVMPMQNYAWTMLNATDPWAITFNSSGTYDRHLVRFSISGVPAKEHLKAEIDGEDLGWAPRLDIGLDRWHYDMYRDTALSEGPHEIKFTLNEDDLEGTAQLCSVEVLEFGNEKEFNATPGYYGLFPTFSEQNKTTYRPTNEDCLMRIVTTPNFCSACTEGLWLSLLRRINLVDDVRTSCIQDPSSGEWKRTIDLDLVPLAQLRTDPVAPKESYKVVWSKAGEVLTEFANHTSIAVDDDVGVTYDIAVEFTTEEVRADGNGYLTAGGDFTLLSKCSE